MKTMKKISRIILCLILACAVTSCGKISIADIATILPVGQKEAESTHAGEYTAFAREFGGEGYEMLSGRLTETGDSYISSITLDDKGKGKLTVNGESADITSWEVSDGNISLTSGGLELTGTIKDGIMILTNGDNTVYYAAEGADISSFEVLSYGDYLTAVGTDYYYGTGADGYDVDKAYSAFLNGSEQGSAYGWFCLGRIYTEKTLEEGHYDKAMEYYEKAADLGSGLGYVGQAYLYQKGKGVDKDPEKAQQLYMKAALEGTLEAYAGIGNMYAYGEIPGISSADSILAKEYYEMAVGSSDFGWRNYARVMIGSLYNGTAEGFDRDFEEEMKWYKEAADEGYGAAMYNIGYMYETGEGVSQDYEQAMEWFVKAAEHGYGNAFAAIGYMYGNGLGVEADDKEAVSWFIKAFENGNTTGTYNLGNMYLDGKGVETDHAKAMRCFELTAAEDYPDSFNNMAYMYINGLGVDRSYEKAIECYEEGIEAGSGWCAANIGNMYASGAGTGKDVNKAIECIQEAIELEGYDDELMEYAESILGVMVQNGDITRADASAILNNAHPETVIFSDVKEDAYYYDAVSWAVSEGITNGMKDGSFGVGVECSRRDMIVFLWRLAGSPSSSAALVFNDISAYESTSDTYKALAWAGEKGIAKAFADGGFHPQETISRKDALTMLYRMAGKPEPQGIVPSTDDIAAMAKELNLNAQGDVMQGIQWALDNGIAKVYSDAAFRPYEGCTREQVITFLFRYSQLKEMR